MLDPRGVDRTNKVARWPGLFFALVAALAGSGGGVDRAQDRLHPGPAKELRARLSHRQQHLHTHTATAAVSDRMGAIFVLEKTVAGARTLAQSALHDAG